MPTNRVVEKKLKMIAVITITTMAFGVYLIAASIVSNNRIGIDPVSFADDIEDEDNNGGDSNPGSGDNGNGSQSESAKKQAERARELAKKRSELKREADKRQFEQERETNKQLFEQNREAAKKNDELNNNEGFKPGDGDGDEDENGNEPEDDTDENNSATFDQYKSINKLNEKLAEAEKQILEKQTEGVDVTAALARLAAAKEAINSAGNAFDSNNLEEAKHLARDARKFAHFAEEEDLRDAEKISEETNKIIKLIGQAKKKLAVLKALGGDSGVFDIALSDIAASVAKATTLIMNGGEGMVSGFSLLDTAERRAKDAKDSIENAIFALGGSDAELGDDHRSAVAQFVKGLNDVADIEEGGIGNRVRSVARAQQLSAEQISERVKSMEDRSPFTEFFIGPKTDDLKQIQDEIAANNVRVDILNRALAQVTDTDVQAMLSAQVETLQKETIKLQNFVNAQLARNSLLGWLSKLLPQF